MAVSLHSIQCRISLQASSVRRWRGSLLTEGPTRKLKVTSGVDASTNFQRLESAGNKSSREGNKIICS